jgi:hypothetical protein
MQIVAFVPGAQDVYQAKTVTINGPASVQMKIDRYVALGPLMIETSSLVAIIVILLAIILFVAVEVYRRKKPKPALET